MPDMLVKLYELPELAPLLMDLREKGITIRRGMPPEKHNVIAWVKKRIQ